LRWFKKRQEETSPAAVQLRSGERHPFGMLENYVPLSRGETRLYRAVREAVPVVDAAIYKLIRTKQLKAKKIAQHYRIQKAEDKGSYAPYQWHCPR